MRPLRLPAVMLAAALILSGFQVYSVPVVSAAQKERSAHPGKPLKFHYVCPMHEDITLAETWDVSEVQNEIG